MSQTHLDKVEALNLGSFYTPDFVIKIVYEMLLNALSKANLKDFTLLDSSCGYGNFLQTPQAKDFQNAKFAQKIGIDIDEKALQRARQNFADLKNPPHFLHKNALLNVTRANFGIKENAKLIIIGNPPYNDKTSIIQNHLKSKDYSVDTSLKCRDLGASFLLSFNELKADFICVLHPLSYLIKESNFKALKRFFASYTLLNSLIISSQIFCPNSLGFFPIIIALYKRDKKGIEYDFIKNYTFKTINGKEFCLSDYEFIGDFIDKYPNKTRVKDKIAMFYTLRDINALRRSKTFIEKDCANAVYITREKHSLYCYVDVFKQIIKNVPYYFGNCDVMIDYAGFKRLENEFIKASNSKRLSPAIKDYFENLLGVHHEK